MQTVYDFTANDLAGNPISLSVYQGKVLLIVNVASQCGFTPQYGELQELYDLYKDKGLVVLGFPSNQFGEQEPLNGTEIQTFCSVNYGVTFPLFEKIDVKGKDAHPLFEYLSNRNLNGEVNISPKWNFQKYLVDKNGYVVDYFLSTTGPMYSKVQKAIEALLQTPNRIKRFLVEN